jgi:hypothetical protein
LYTDENPKGTIKGLKFATKEDATKSVSRIKGSGRSKAHKIQAAIAMEQRAKVMGKRDAAGVYRRYINSVKANIVGGNTNYFRTNVLRNVISVFFNLVSVFPLYCSETITVLNVVID